MYITIHTTTWIQKNPELIKVVDGIGIQVYPDLDTYIQEIQMYPDLDPDPDFKNPESEYIIFCFYKKIV